MNNYFLYITIIAAGCKTPNIYKQLFVKEEDADYCLDVKLKSLIACK